MYEIFLQKEKQTAVAGGSWLALNRELKKHRRRRLRKRLLKSEVALLQTLLRLFHRVKFVKCWHFFLELNSKRMYRSTGKERESRCLVFTFSTFPRRSRAVTAKKCTKKRDARAKLLFCQSKSIAFLPFSLPLPSTFLRKIWDGRETVKSPTTNENQALSSLLLDFKTVGFPPVKRESLISRRVATKKCGFKIGWKARERRNHQAQYLLQRRRAGRELNRRAQSTQAQRT